MHLTFQNKKLVVLVESFFVWITTFLSIQKGRIIIRNISSSAVPGYGQISCLSVLQRYWSLRLLGSPTSFRMYSNTNFGMRVSFILSKCVQVFLQFTKLYYITYVVLRLLWVSICPSLCLLVPTYQRCSHRGIFMKFYKGKFYENLFRI